MQHAHSSSHTTLMCCARCVCVGSTPSAQCIISFNTHHKYAHKTVCVRVCLRRCFKSLISEHRSTSGRAGPSERATTMKLHTLSVPCCVRTHKDQVFVIYHRSGVERGEMLQRLSPVRRCVWAMPGDRVRRFATSVRIHTHTHSN